MREPCVAGRAKSAAPFFVSMHPGGIQININHSAMGIGGQNAREDSEYAYAASNYFKSQCS